MFHHLHPSTNPFLVRKAEPAFLALPVLYLTPVVLQEEVRGPPGTGSGVPRDMGKCCSNHAPAQSELSNSFPW